MATLREQTEALYASPQIRGFLNMLAHAEGTAGRGDNGYNVNFGGSLLNSYRDHPRTSRQFKQTDGKTNNTTAAGRYQFIGSTWDDQARKQGLTDFSPRSQDLAAIGLLIQNGAVNDIMQGNTTAAVNKLGKTWASLPSSTYPQGKQSWSNINKWLQEGGLPPAQPTRSNDLGPLPEGIRQSFSVGEQMSPQSTVFGAQSFYEEPTVPSGAVGVGNEILSAVPEVGLPIVQNGQRMLAVPETETDYAALQRYGTYDLPTRGAMVRLQDQIKQAEESAKRQLSVFDPYPTEFDEALRRLIRIEA